MNVMPLRALVPLQETAGPGLGRCFESTRVACS